MFKNPFSFEGRIRRTEYGLSIIIFVVARVIVTFIAIAIVDPRSYDDLSAVNPIALIFTIPLLWFLWAQTAKRCHDVGNSGWWQLIPFYPLVILFQPGELGKNKYGDNPKQIQQVIGGQIGQGGKPNATNGGSYPGDYKGGHNNPNTNYNQSGQETETNRDGYKDGDLYN